VALSAGYRFESAQVAQECAQALLEHAGPERLLWGSDGPFAAFEDSMRYGHAIEEPATADPGCARAPDRRWGDGVSALLHLIDDHELIL
jgi:hypothetical protein